MADLRYPLLCLNVLIARIELEQVGNYAEVVPEDCLVQYSPTTVLGYTVDEIGFLGV